MDSDSKKLANSIELECNPSPMDDESPAGIKQPDESIVLEQWRTCVEMASQTSSRRDSMNNLFITINLSLIAAISITWQFKSSIMAIAGMIFCVIWFFLLSYYRNLNASKFNSILKLEKMLPARPFEWEWGDFKQKESPEGTNIEKVIPTIFFTVHAVLLVFLLVD